MVTQPSTQKLRLEAGERGFVCLTSCQECRGTLIRDRRRRQDATEREANLSDRRGRAKDYRYLALMLLTSTVLKLNQLTNLLAFGQEAVLQPAPFYGWTSRVSNHNRSRKNYQISGSSPTGCQRVSLPAGVGVHLPPSFISLRTCRFTPNR